MAGGWWHIVLVGTSCLRNIAGTLGDKELSRLAINPDMRLTDEVKSRFNEYFRLLASDPFKFSAELNAMRNYLEENSVSGVTLIYTDTDGGMLAAQLLSKYFELKAIPVRSFRVEHLGRVFELGVLNLLDRLASEVKEIRDKGYKIAINLTGGFKAETGYALLIASLLGVDKAYYIYESGFTPVELPLIPLKPREDYVNLISLLEEREYTYLDLCKILSKMGLSVKIIDELRDKGLLEEINGGYRPRTWILMYKKIIR